MILSFSALRFMNALMIFFHHKNSIESPFLEAFGPCAVSFFFILSGFSMCFGYYEKCLKSEFNWKNFMIRRFVRIYPLHILCLCTWLLLNFRNILRGGVLANILLIQSWIPDSSIYFSCNAVSWCLSDLMFFYALFPFVVKLIQNKRFLLLFSVIFILFYTISILFMPEKYAHGVVYINPLYRFADFYIGILLFRLYKATMNDRNFKNNFSALFFQILSAFIVLISLYAYKCFPEKIKYQCLFFIPNAIVVFVFAFYDQYGIAKLFHNRFFYSLGKISFDFYLIHTLGISFINSVLEKCGLEISFIYRALLQFMFVLMGSFFVYYFYDKKVASKLSLIFMEEK